MRVAYQNKAKQGETVLCDVPEKRKPRRHDVLWRIKQKKTRPYSFVAYQPDKTRRHKLVAYQTG